MTKAAQLIRGLKRELKPVEREILGHPYLDELDAGRLERTQLAMFAGEQYHIIRSDLRSVALLVNRFGAAPSGPFFQGVLSGEAAALAALRGFARAVGLNDARLQAYEPNPGAQAYPAYMAWLALYGSDAEVAAGFLVNFAAWGINCGRMSRALRARYGMEASETAFFDLFASPPAEFEAGALAVVESGLARGADPRLIKRAARLLQGYEKLYWDTLLTPAGR
ncbi:MAG: transcriptional regulator [Candidatus Rokubacteria bacterium]|nr:transcriptional regulator [Candidatus Rokubacteria bacterium]